MNWKQHGPPKNLNLNESIFTRDAKKKNSFPCDLRAVSTNIWRHIGISGRKLKSRRINREFRIAIRQSHSSRFASKVVDRIDSKPSGLIDITPVVCGVVVERRVELMRQTHDEIAYCSPLGGNLGRREPVVQIPDRQRIACERPLNTNTDRLKSN